MKLALLISSLPFSLKDYPDLRYNAGLYEKLASKLKADQLDIISYQPKSSGIKDHNDDSDGARLQLAIPNTVVNSVIFNDEIDWNSYDLIISQGLVKCDATIRDSILQVLNKYSNKSCYFSADSEEKRQSSALMQLKEIIPCVTNTINYIDHPNIHYFNCAQLSNDPFYPDDVKKEYDIFFISNPAMFKDYKDIWTNRDTFGIKQKDPGRWKFYEILSKCRSLVPSMSANSKYVRFTCKLYETYRTRSSSLIQCVDKKLFKELIINKFNVEIPDYFLITMSELDNIHELMMNIISDKMRFEYLGIADALVKQIDKLNDEAIDFIIDKLNL